MRKLSKKISMLMVLAMLVSLFSGIVSASAASAWSFKSAKYDVAVGETIEMEKNEYADFDLFKNDAAPEGYTVKWSSSDPDAVWVNSGSGQLRADKFKTADLGDKATISATFTNTKTGKSATRSFVIVVAEKAEYALTVKVGEAVLGAETLVADKEYALTSTVTLDGEAVEATVAYTVDGAAVTALKLAEGEYTVVATATIDGKVVATETYEVVAEATAPEFVEAKQVALNTVEIAMNDADWVNNAVANKDLIKVAQVIDGVDIAELVKTVEAKKDAASTLVVTLYNNLTAKATYKFEYDGFECAASVVGAGSEPYKIEVVSKKVPANTLGQAEIKVYNAAGIDVTTEELKYAAKFTAGENTFCDVQEDGGIYFFEVGKTIAIKAEFDMGWDSEGNELTDLTAVGEYTSVDAVTYSKPNGYALNDSNNPKANKDLTYSNSLKISLSDENYVLVAKYEEAPFNADVVTKYITDGDDEHGNIDAYTYKSTNESVLLVEEATGELKPCKEGYASVYIKKGDAVVGSVSIKVDAARKLSTFTASIADKKLATAIDDSTEIVVKAADQFGVAYPHVKYSMVLDTLKVNNADVTLASFFEIADATNLTVTDGKIALPLSDAAAAALADNKVQAIAFTIKATDTEVANNEKTQRLSVSIKDNDGYTGTVTRKLSVSTSKMDVALNKKNLTDYNVTIKLDKTDSDGYELGLENIAFEASATTGNPYSVVVTKVGDNSFNATTSDFFNLVGNEIKITTVIDATTKLATGTYKIQLFTKNGDKMQPSTPQYLTIEDTTPAVTAVVTKTNIGAGEIAKALEFYINGTKVDAENITGVAISDSVETEDGSKIYVKKVTVTLKTLALNGESKLGLEFNKEVAVNQLFTIIQVQ